MALFRPSDSKMSENGLKFHYIPHGEIDTNFDMDKVDYEKSSGEKLFFENLSQFPNIKQLSKMTQNNTM